ncbi:MAG: hypothetical protein ACFCUE_02570 [Candidatus Bathyarchaeia archaeon]|jgi:hypothetical protein
MLKPVKYGLEIGSKMEEDMLVVTRQVNCNHAKERQYTQRRFDILNGYELTLTRCINCHKTLSIEVKKFGNSKPSS